MTTTAHPLNRHLFIVDNIHLLHRLDNESVDLIVTDPPFGKQKTFTGDRLKPALEPRELKQEMSQMVDWGITERMLRREELSGQMMIAVHLTMTFGTGRKCM